MMNRKIIVLLFLVTFLLFTGCGKKEEGGPTPSESKSLDVVGLSDEYDYTGEEIKPRITIRYNGKVLTEGKDYELEYKDNVEVGTATIVVISKNKDISSYEAHFHIVDNTIDINNVDVSGLEPFYVYSGEEIRPGIIVEYDDQLLIRTYEYNLDYSNNIEPGEAEIIITGIGKYRGTKIVKFTIAAKDPVINCNSVVYTGEPLTIASCIDGTIIENEKQTDAGVYVVKCQSSHDSSKIATKSCEISPKDISGASVEVIDSYYEANGSPINPNVNPKVTLDGIVLKLNIDYTIKYENNIEAGRAIAVVTGKGNYTGTVRSASFYIYSKNSGKSGQTLEVIQIDGYRNIDKDSMYSKSGKTYIEIYPDEVAQIMYKIPVICTKFVERVGNNVGGVSIENSKVQPSYYLTPSYSDVSDGSGDIQKRYKNIKYDEEGNVVYILTITPTENAKNYVEKYNKGTPWIRYSQYRTYKTENYKAINFSSGSIYVRVIPKGETKTAQKPSKKCCCYYEDLTKCSWMDEVTICPKSQPFEDTSQKACGGGTTTSTSKPKVTPKITPKVTVKPTAVPTTKPTAKPTTKPTTKPTATATSSGVCCCTSNRSICSWMSSCNSNAPIRITGATEKTCSNYQKAQPTETPHYSIAAKVCCCTKEMTSCQEFITCPDKYPVKTSMSRCR